MADEILKMEPEISNEFDVLWEASGGGPDASVRGFQAAIVNLGIPRSPRSLRAEDFRDWLLP